MDRAVRPYYTSGGATPDPRSISATRVIGLINIFTAVARILGGKPGAAILGLSALVAAWIALFGGFVFFIDSVDFFDYAARLVHFRIGSYYDAIGYPLLIRFTGFTRTGSLIPVVVCQAVFAALTPWLAFRTFAPLDRKIGVAAATVSLASLTPFFFQNTFFHDGLSLFLGFLSITFASMFFHFQRSRYIHLSSASAMCAYLTQPAVIGFFLGCWGAFMLFALRDRRQIKHVLAALGIFAATIFCVSTFEKWSMREDHLADSPSLLGRQIFYNEYLRGAPNASFSGSAADELRAALVRYFGHSSARLHSYIAEKFEGRTDVYQRLFGQYEGRPVELVRQIFAQPNHDYFDVMWNFPDLPDKLPDSMFLHASLAYLYFHPGVVAGYVSRNLIDFMAGSPWRCTGDQVFPACRIDERVTFYPALDSVTLAPGRMPDNAYRFLIARRVSQGFPMLAAASMWQWIYYHFRLPLLGAMLLGWVASFWVSSALRWTLGAFVVAYIVNLTVFSFLAEPGLRYQIVGISMCAFAAGGGACLILNCLVRAAAMVLSKEVDRNAGGG